MCHILHFRLVYICVLFSVSQCHALCDYDPCMLALSLDYVHAIITLPACILTPAMLCNNDYHIVLSKHDVDSMCFTLSINLGKILSVFVISRGCCCIINPCNA